MRAAVRTAAVAGTAAAVGGRVQHRQNEKWQQEAEAQAYEQQVAQQPMAAAPAAPAPAAAAEAGMSHVEQLQQLAALREQGVLTDAEFETEKAKILNS